MMMDLQMVKYSLTKGEMRGLINLLLSRESGLKAQPAVLTEDVISVMYSKCKQHNKLLWTGEFDKTEMDETLTHFNTSTDLYWKAKSNK